MRKATYDEGFINLTVDRHSFFLTRLETTPRPIHYSVNKLGYSGVASSGLSLRPPSEAIIDFINQFLQKICQLCTQRPAR